VHKEGEGQRERQRIPSTLHAEPTLWGA